MAKILVVEDDALNREMITRRLTWEGHTVVTATNGKESIALTMAEQPDIVLMDMGLPVLSGWQASSHLKTAHATCHIPIIALTAFATSDDRQRSFSAGCDEFESKPIDFRRLLKKITTLTDACGTRADVASGASF